METWSVADQLAIRNIYAAYTFAVDDHDLVAFADCFTADAEIGFANFGALTELLAAGGASFLDARGRAVGTENIKAVLGMAPKGALRLHLSTNIEITRLEGNKAEGRAAFCVIAEDGQVKHYGRYLDKLARCPDGRWRFSERIDSCHWERPRSMSGGL